MPPSPSPPAPPTSPPSELKWKQRLQLKLSGYSYIGQYWRMGWTATFPHYVMKCPVCEAVSVSRPHGWRGWLQCSPCEEPRVYQVGYRRQRAIKSHDDKAPINLKRRCK